MKSITKRTIVSLILAGILILGTGIFVFNFFTKGSEWASYPANSHLYTNGILNSGTLLDKDGAVLADAHDGTWSYHDDQTTRKALLHTVGVPDGTIYTGAITRFAGKLTGYNFLTGAQHIGKDGNKVYLTVDADVCRAAYKALGSYKGTVCVYNYETGEIICLVSTPTYDPAYPPAISDSDPNYDGVYVNRALSASFIPGSTFKLITLTAALEEIPDVTNMSFYCGGSVDIGDKTITCTGTHGDISLEKALNVSCNCAFAYIADMLGGKTLDKYTKETGLTDSYSVNGISTKASSFGFKDDPAGEVAWGGVGQGHDLVNPCSMMIYMGAVANGGKAAVPQIIEKTTLQGGLKTGFYIKKQTERLVNSATAEIITQYMKSNVVNTYGESRFPGLDIYGKTGTAQVDSSDSSNSWFVGFIKNEDAPLAFAVYAEGGGSGSRTAATIANTVLQEAVKSVSTEEE
ncbi:MAG: penicillin-binding protein [Firmicutes bacterium]|nr:penicillin-binding protein [Bacillota bacterium]